MLSLKHFRLKNKFLWLWIHAHFIFKINVTPLPYPFLQKQSRKPMGKVGQILVAAGINNIIDE